MKKFAIFFKSGNECSSNAEVVGFTYADSPEYIDLNVYYECECEIDCDDCDQNEEFCNGNCPEPECYCESWTEEVDIDVIKWDWYSDRFYTQKQLDQEKIDRKIEKRDINKAKRERAIEEVKAKSTEAHDLMLENMILDAEIQRYKKEFKNKYK